eukprot:TRINITY_DN8767_c0_g2_i3.p1 TRINITY_DN8767_c0_g2~~TRINITY_DN8767_c0_g2_i3.p1  ORF type:complete len:119 (-),score=7.50 TRINITY_DN8767_c0_g2_i3:70-426(-)
MKDQFTINSSMIYSVNVMGHCGESLQVSGTLRQLSPGLATLEWFGQPLYALSKNERIIFKSFTQNTECVPSTVECENGKCSPFPVGVVVGVTVVVVLVLSFGLFFFIWQKRRSHYQTI